GDFDEPFFRFNDVRPDFGLDASALANARSLQRLAWRDFKVHGDIGEELNCVIHGRMTARTARVTDGKSKSRAADDSAPLLTRRNSTRWPQASEIYPP